MLCPSTTLDRATALIGLVDRAEHAEGRITYMVDRCDVPRALHDAAGEIDVGTVARLAGPCAQSGCAHHTSGGCTLAERITATLPVVVDRLPTCSIRRTCRWWHDQGAAACHRCPAITSSAPAEPTMVSVGAPPG